MSATALDLPGLPLADERESLAEEVRTVGMVWEREAIRFFRTRARIASSFIQPVLFLFVLGYGMSTLVGTTAGFDFKKFLFPGIVAMTVMSTAISSAISIVWDREFGFLHEMLVARSAAPHWYSARPSAGPASPPSRAPSCPTNGGRAHGQAPGNQEQPMVRQGSGTGPAAPAPGHGRGDDRGADHRGGRTCSAGYGCTRPTSSSSCWAP